MSASLQPLPAHPQVAVIGVGNRGGAMLARDVFAQASAQGLAQEDDAALLKWMRVTDKVTTA